MTKEDLLKSIEIIIQQNSNVEKAADLIFELWANHPSYAVVAGKVVHKETGKEIGA
jgi:hypothetical protein